MVKARFVNLEYDNLQKSKKMNYEYSSNWKDNQRKVEECAYT
jgi:hypothetical protein